MAHVPVLLKEIIENAKIKPKDILLDCTLGAGGHAESLAKSCGGNLTIVGLDEDSGTLGKASKRLEETGAKVIAAKENFRHLDKVLASNRIAGVSAVLFDLGFSSDQLQDSGRGFSFQKDEPLLMTLSDAPEGGTITAAQMVNGFEENNLETIIRNYGEEPRAKKIAAAIVNARKNSRIETSMQLAKIIESAARRVGKIHPATKTFQALRIAVNDELGALEEALPKALDSLKAGGRLLVISFHSLEDRIVKNFGKDNKEVMAPINKKPITASEEEIRFNPRSRSAKLRIFEKK